MTSESSASTTLRWRRAGCELFFNAWKACVTTLADAVAIMALLLLPFVAESSGPEALHPSMAPAERKAYFIRPTYVTPLAKLNQQVSCVKLVKAVSPPLRRPLQPPALASSTLSM